MNWGILLGAIAAIGAGSISTWGLLALGDVAGRFRRFRSVANPAQRFFDAEQAASDEFTDDDLYGLRGIPWPLLRVAGAGLGVALTWMLLGERNPALSVLGLGGILAPRLIRAYLVRQGQIEIDRQVRSLIFLLRAALAVFGGLRPALEEVARRLEPGVVQSRLGHHLERSFAADPATAIEHLAGDIHSEELDHLLLGITAARRGSMGYTEAVVEAADEAGERINEQARVAIEETPMRLLIPMLLLLLPPFLVLSLYPLLARVMALLATPGSMPGGF